MRRALALLSILAGCAHSSGSQPGASEAPKDWKSQVPVAEAKRDGFDPAIRATLASPDPKLRRAGLWALARIEEVGTASLAAALLTDSDPKVAASAAFALGQIGGPEATRALRKGLPETRAVPAALRALARTGTVSAAAQMVAYFGAPEPEVRAAAALSLGLLKKRLPKVDQALAIRLVPLVAAVEPEVRYGAAYALARFPGPEAAVALVSALADKDPEVRLWAVTGLGKSGANPTVFDAVMRDPDWRVRAATAQALGEMAKLNPTEANRSIGRLSALAKNSFARLSSGDRLESGRALHILRAAIRGATTAGKRGRKVIEALEQATWETENLPPSVSGDLARVQCWAAEALDRLDKVARRIETCGKGMYARWRRYSTWLDLRAAQGGKGAVSEIVPFARSPDARLRTAAVMALGKLGTKAAADALWALVNSNDVAVAGAAVETLAGPKFAEHRPKAAAERLFDGVERLLPQPDDSLVVGAIDALAHLGDEAKPLVGQIRKLLDDPRPAIRRRAAKLVTRLTEAPTAFGPSTKAVERPNPWPRAIDVLLETQRGQVVLRVDGGKAPRFAGTIKHLVEAGYYDRLTFHRVVSNFVTQGGCPRGDGWGGPGYSVPAETSAAPFSRGAIGIATNGRDTGGSQFFVMHARHPHLEGRYPWIGRVVDGIDVLDALQPDDVILRATLKRAP